MLRFARMRESLSHVVSTFLEGVCGILVFAAGILSNFESCLCPGLYNELIFNKKTKKWK